MKLEVSLNNLSFSGSGITFRYHDEVALRALYPPSGAAAGGGWCFLQGFVRRSCRG